jgi:hypothetical protein
LVHSRSMKFWIKERGANGQVSRIVVDEAHTIISENKFRQSFTLVARLVKSLAVPIVLMTGTLPKSLEVRLVEAFSNCGPIPSVRLPTDRPNLSYNISPTPANQENMEAIALLYQERIVTRLMEDPKERAIFFVQTTEQAELLAEMLNAGLYMNPLPLEVKQKYLLTWLDPNSTDIAKHTLVATSSLCLGIDYDNCPNIWFFGDPYGGIINFAQMAARAGRNNKHADILLFPADPPRSDNYQDEDMTDWQNFKSTKGCRRLPLSRHLDGSPSTCASLVNAALCDNCKLHITHPIFSDHDPAQALLPLFAYMADNMLLYHMSNIVRVIYAFVPSFPDCCIYCRIKNDGKSSVTHKADHCPSGLYRKRAAMKVTLSRIRKENHVHNFSACLGCHLPQHKSIPGAMHYHLPFHGDGERDCQLQWPMVDFFLGLLSSPRYTQALSYHVTDPNEIFTWLLSTIKDPPCDPLSEGHQLLRLHFVLASVAGTSPYPPLQAVSLAQEPWFQRWALEPVDTTSQDTFLKRAHLDRLPTERASVEQDDEAMATEPTAAEEELINQAFLDVLASQPSATETPFDWEENIDIPHIPDTRSAEAACEEELVNQMLQGFS